MRGWALRAAWPYSLRIVVARSLSGFAQDYHIFRLRLPLSSQSNFYCLLLSSHAHIPNDLRSVCESGNRWASLNSIVVTIEVGVVGIRRSK